MSLRTKYEKEWEEIVKRYEDQIKKFEEKIEFWKKPETAEKLLRLNRYSSELQRIDDLELKLRNDIKRRFLKITEWGEPIGVTDGFMQLLKSEGYKLTRTKAKQIAVELARRFMRESKEISKLKEKRRKLLDKYFSLKKELGIDEPPFWRVPPKSPKKAIEIIERAIRNLHLKISQLGSKKEYVRSQLIRHRRSEKLPYEEVKQIADALEKKLKKA